MPTRSIRLSDSEASELQHLLAETGESEESLLRRAALRGIRDLRIEEGIRAFQTGRGSSDAAAVAGVPRAVFLQMLLDRGVTVLDGPGSFAEDLDVLAQRLGDDRLAGVARTLRRSET
jgi:hypothetical protein